MIVVIVYAGSSALAVAETQESAVNSSAIDRGNAQFEINFRECFML